MAEEKKLTADQLEVERKINQYYADHDTYLNLHSKLEKVLQFCKVGMVFSLPGLLIPYVVEVPLAFLFTATAISLIIVAVMTVTAFL